MLFRELTMSTNAPPSSSVDRSSAPAEHPLLLVVDDEPSICHFLTRCAEARGFGVVCCSDGQEALDYLEQHSVDVALIDLRMPLVGGLEVLRVIREKDPHCQVVLMSGAGTIHDAVEAIKLGARDYLQKPFDMAVLATLLDQIRGDVDKRKTVLALREQLGRETEFCGMTGHSPVMHELFNLIRRLAPHVKTALITGESGTGKELVARALHRLGPRSERQFLIVNCSGLAEALGESDLFGHVAGAFPGATVDRAGAFESANGHVLFLDEVGELPLALQGRLLRVLEDGVITRVGSLESHAVDVAVIAGTKRDLRTEMLAGRFRRELFYRLSSVEIRVPPLRDRKDDIPYLAAAFGREQAARVGKPLAGLTAPAEALLRRRDWPGNVRELRNVIEHASIISDGEFITERGITQALQHAQ